MVLHPHSPTPQKRLKCLMPFVHLLFKARTSRPSWPPHAQQRSVYVLTRPYRCWHGSLMRGRGSSRLPLPWWFLGPDWLNPQLKALCDAASAASKLGCILARARQAIVQSAIFWGHQPQWHLLPTKTKCNWAVKFAQGSTWALTSTAYKYTFTHK